MRSKARIGIGHAPESPGDNVGEGQCGPGSSVGAGALGQQELDFACHLWDPDIHLLVAGSSRRDNTYLRTLTQPLAEHSLQSPQGVQTDEHLSGGQRSHRRKTSCFNAFRTSRENDLPEADLERSQAFSSVHAAELPLAHWGCSHIQPCRERIAALQNRMQEC